MNFLYADLSKSSKVSPFLMTNSTSTASPLSFSTIFPKGNPFLESIGIEFVRAGDGSSELALTLRPDHMNSWHVTHGGISMTLIDVAMALAGRTLSPEMQSCVTVDMSTQFLQPGGKPGDRVIVRGKSVHRSSTMCFCEAEVWNGKHLVARGTGTFKYLKRLESGGRMPIRDRGDDA
jgi:acyl-CoA thioesterase